MAHFEGNLWICTDCMMMLANGEETPDRPEEEPEVLALWLATDGTDIVPGDGDIEFSTSRCDGCGSWTAGHRHGAAWFTV